MDALFEELFRDWKDPVFAYVRSMVLNHADAEDVFQATFIKIHQGLTGYQERGNQKAWIYRIAHNAVQDHFRRHQKVVDIADFGDLPDSDAPTPEAVLSDQETREHLQRAVEALSPKLREVVLLRVDGGLKFREIAELLGIPLSRVLGRMHLAVKGLRKSCQRGRHEL